MTDMDAVEYYRRRERREREMASSTTNPAAAAIHFELAAHYAALIAEGAQSERTSILSTTAQAAPGPITRGRSRRRAPAMRVC